MNDLEQPDYPTVPGKRLLPILVVGCLAFATLMGLGTFFIAKWTTPYFERAAKHTQAPKD